MLIQGAGDLLADKANSSSHANYDSIFPAAMQIIWKLNTSRLHHVTKEVLLPFFHLLFKAVVFMCVNSLTDVLPPPRTPTPPPTPFPTLQVTPEEARDSWENQFTFSFKKCSHANW